MISKEKYTHKAFKDVILLFKRKDQVTGAQVRLVPGWDGPDLQQILEWLLNKEPDMKKLHVQFDEPADMGPVISGICKERRTHLQELELKQNDFDPADTESIHDPLPEELEQQFCANTPKLKKLTLIGHHFFPVLSHPYLQELYMTGFPIENFDGMDLPKLKKLDWTFTADLSGGAIPVCTLESLWAGKDLPKLEILHINGEFDDDLTWDQITESANVYKKPPVWKQLKELVLPGLTADSVLEHADEFSHLALLDIGNSDYYEEPDEGSVEDLMDELKQKIPGFVVYEVEEDEDDDIEIWDFDWRIAGEEWDFDPLADDEVNSFIQRLKVDTTVTSISIEFESFCIDLKKAMLAIKAIAEKPDITTLSIRSDFTLDFIEMVKVLRKSSVKSLSISITDDEKPEELSEGIKALADEIENNWKLEMFYFYIRRGDDSIIYLVNALQKNKYIKDIDLRIKDDQLYSALAQTLKKSKTIRSINVQNHPLEKKMIQIWEQIAGHASIEKLMIDGYYDPLSAPQSRDNTFFELLKKASNIKALSLTDFDLSDNERNLLFDSFEQMELKSLSIKDCNFGNSFYKIIQAVPSLSEFNISQSKYRIETNDMKKLLSLLAETAIETISIEMGSIEGCGKETANLLLKNHNIKQMSLAYCHEGDTIPVTEAFLPALQQHQKIEKLDLSVSIEFTPELLKEFAIIIKKHPSLKNLKLRITELKDSGVRLLANALEESNLEELVLYDCDVKSKGVALLAEVLKKNKKLKSLDLSNNNIPDKAMALLLNSLQENDTLKHIDLFKNRAGIETIAAFRDLKKAKPEMFVRIGDEE